MAGKVAVNGVFGATAPRRVEKPWRRYFRLTREGKAFIFVTAGVGLAAVNTGNNLLFLIFGFMLSLIVLSGILSEIVLRGVRIERRVPQRVFAGSTCLIELTLANTKRRVPSYSLEVEDLAHESVTERRCYFLKVAKSAEQVAGYRRAVHKRGPLKFTSFRVATRYPFGIIEKWRLFDAPAELLVYPALLREDQFSAALHGMGADGATSRVGPGHEVAGLRNYQPGDPARDIHWRRTAALGRVMVYERHADASTQLSILLDNARPAGANAHWDAGFERAISKAAATAVAGLRRNLTTEVVCRGRRSPLCLPGASPDSILRFLALLESVPASDSKHFGKLNKSARVVQIPVVATPEAG
jgi:uncharacterized protein (DUF58 family)